METKHPFISHHMCRVTCFFIFLNICISNSVAFWQALDVEVVFALKPVPFYYLMEIQCGLVTFSPPFHDWRTGVEKAVARSALIISWQIECRLFPTRATC